MIIKSIYVKKNFTWQVRKQLTIYENLPLAWFTHPILLKPGRCVHLNHFFDNLPFRPMFLFYWTEFVKIRRTKYGGRNRGWFVNREAKIEILKYCFWVVGEKRLINLGIIGKLFVVLLINQTIMFEVEKKNCEISVTPSNPGKLHNVLTDLFVDLIIGIWKLDVNTSCECPFKLGRTT